VEDIANTLTGHELKKAFAKAHQKRAALAEGFLYEKTVTMMAADPGSGKSTITIQLAVELAAGLPVFGIFPVQEPVKVMYIQAERSILELLERLEEIDKTVPVNVENLTISTDYQGYNLMKEAQAQAFVKGVKKDSHGARLIIVDPIYPMVMGGLKEDIPTATFCSVMDDLQKQTGASIWYNHHTVKAQYDKGQRYEKEDPFYGSQFLKAHVTGSFYLKEKESGVEILKKKDNYRCLPDKIVLEFNPENGLCTAPFDELPTEERVKIFLRAQKTDDRIFTFEDIERGANVCARTLRRHLMAQTLKSLLIVHKVLKNKNFYKVTKAQF